MKEGSYPFLMLSAAANAAADDEEGDIDDVDGEASPSETPMAAASSFRRFSISRSRSSIVLG